MLSKLSSSTLSYTTPLELTIFSKAFSIGLMFVLYLASEDAVISPVA